MTDEDPGTGERPDEGGGGAEFGPGGYLPPRAAHRARKIVLRAPLGIQWVVASVVTAVVLLVVGLVLLRSTGGAPGRPFVAAGEVPPMGAAERVVVGDAGVLVVNAGGIRALAVDDHPTAELCGASGRIETGDGRVFSLTGRALDGEPSLASYPVVVHDGAVYVDPTRTLPPVPGADEGVEPACS